MGKGKFCFAIGHFALKDLEPKEAAMWSQALIGNETEVTYIPTRKTFSYQNIGELS